MFNPDDIKSCIEEWMGDTCDIKEICDTYIVIVREAEKQYEFILGERIKEIKGE